MFETFSPDNDARWSTMLRTNSLAARQKSDLLRGKPVSVCCLKYDARRIAYFLRPLFPVQSGLRNPRSVQALRDTLGKSDHGDGVGIDTSRIEQNQVACSVDGVKSEDG